MGQNLNHGNTCGLVVKPYLNNKKKTFASIILVCLLLVIIGWLVVTKNVRYRQNSETEQPVAVLSADPPLASNVQSNTTRLIATGDFIAHDAINADAKTANGYDFSRFVAPMEPLFRSAGIRFCNQATLVGGEAFGVTGYPIFNAPESFIDAMVGVGCNVINTASNHSSDKTQDVIDANVALWQKESDILAVAGQSSSEAQKQKVSTFEVDGLQYAFLAYTTYSNTPPKNSYGVSMYDRKFAEQQVKEAKAKGARFIIVSMRWGTEYSPEVTAYQRAEAAYLASLDVDLVLGHGTHVLAPVEVLPKPSGGNMYVWYGLGNFLHAQVEPETIYNGVAVIEIDAKTASVQQVGFLPTYMHYDWTKEQAASQQLQARKNFLLMPLEQADTYIKNSFLNAIPEEQQKRITSLLSMYTPVPLLTLEQLGIK